MKHPEPDPAPRGAMTEEQIDRLLAECLEEYHRERARGEVPDLAQYRGRLGDLQEEFLELIAAETVIDEALEPPGDAPLPMAWGSYTLLREIARGAAGVVYEALHRKLGRKVALKVLRTGVDTDESARERFRREAQALAQVHHDNIVDIYEFGEVEGRPFYAMTLIQGPTLAGLVKRGQKPEPRAVCRGLAGVADALATLHAAGIIHRDVKPSNIMIDEHGRYMLADFGLARSAMSTTMTRTGDALGTPLYMSPEQMLGTRDGIEERTDVYGLGATLYELLTGRPPFKTDNLHALMRMVLKDRPTPPRTLEPGLPAGCSRIAMTCLEKEPRDRYPSALALKEDLLAFAEDRRVAARPLSRLQRGTRWVQERPAWAAAAMVLIAFGVWMAAKPNPAHVSIQASPASVAAQVKIGDGAWVAVPVRGLELAPGAYKVKLRSQVEGFGERSFDMTLARGVEREIDTYIKIVDPTHPNVVAAISGKAVDVPDDDIKRHRGEDGVAIELAWPRGDLRRSDLATWRVFVDVDFADRFPDGGHLVFRRGDEEFARLDFPLPNNYEESGPLPPKVRDSLEAGEQVSWSFEGADGKSAARASFRISAEDVEADLATIDQRLAVYPEETQKAMRPTLRANALLGHGYAQAAWVELEPLLYKVFHPHQPEFRAKEEISLLETALAQRALELMYPESSERSDSARWGQVATLQGYWSSDERAAFFAAQRDPKAAK